MRLKRQISEKDLLRLLDIPSFRHISKDKLVSFVSTLPEIDPEVAKKALEQFPDFATAMIEITERYKEVFVKKQPDGIAIFNNRLREHNQIASCPS